MMRYLIVILFVLWTVPGWGAEGTPPPDPAPGAADFKTLYREGDDKGVIELFQGKKVENSAQALTLGLSYLRLGRRSEAIGAWKGYVRMEPGGEGTREISRYLTLLLREEAKRTAKEILQREKNLSQRIDARAIAVSPFENLGKAAFAPLSKGLTEMIITDLSKVKTLKVVERIQIQAILNELKLSQSGLVDKKSAPRVGKLLGAGKMTTGSFLDVDEERLRLDAMVTQTETGKLLTSPEITGGMADFFQLEKTLVFKILCGIGQCPESLDSHTKASVEKVHTTNLKAFRLYSQGLDLLDQEKYREASRFFFLAVEEDPEFELARKSLLETPLFPLSLSAMIASAEAIGRGEKGGFTTPVPPVLPALPERRAGQEAISPGIGMLTPPAAPAPPPAVPVQVQVHF